MKKLFCFVALIAACSSDGDNGLPPIEVDDMPAFPTDSATSNNGQPDMSASDMGAGGPIVDFDLGPFMQDPPDANETVRVYEVTDEADLFEGPVALGKVGDWIIENDTARFLIEGPTRNMNPCPWGGNVLDAIYLKGQQPPEDILGEVCLLMNASFTLKPDQYDILPGENGAGVLAVSGVLTIGDFINLKAMVDDVLPGFGEQIEVITDTVPQTRVTVYYVLRPGDSGLKVVTAVRNDDEVQSDLVGAHLIASGGDGYYFNPLSRTRGFGASDLGETLSADNLPFLVFNGERSSYAYMPEPVERLSEDTAMPIGGGYIVISGVAAALLGRIDILQVLLAKPEPFSQLEGVLHLQPGEIGRFVHTHYVGDGSISTVTDHAFDALGVETVLVSGNVKEDDGSPAQGARVTAVEVVDNRAFTQVITDANGDYSFRLPKDESFTLSARRGNQPPAITQVVGTAADLTVGDLTLEALSTIQVNITREDGSPVAGRVTVICEGPCNNLPTLQEEDIDFHRMPDEFAAIEYTNIDGIANIPVPGGESYRVVVSRGMEWSVWPEDALTQGGVLVTPTMGETVVLDAEIGHVLQTPFALSGDFHIHTIGSPDSTVAHMDRVKNFLAEGVDVIVTTDHDIITDFAPAIAALGAQDHIASVIGEEITTSDLGHMNGFPMTLDNDVNRRGGAIDWGGGDSFGLTPAEIFAAIDEAPGEQVIQINHAAGGLMRMADADPLRGMTFADRESSRMPPADPDPVSGDTGLWSDNFTAMELLNGNSQGKFWELAHWWMLMIGRGFAPTGTAVTDTHKLYGDLGGVPRTYTWVDGAVDEPSTFDEPTFVAQVNAGNAIGTNGPFFSVEFENDAQEIVGLGGTLATNGTDVTARITLQVPAWIDVDTIDVYMNPQYADVKADAGEFISDPIPPTTSVAVTWNGGDNDTIVGTTRNHTRRVQTIEIPLNPGADAFVIFVIRGSESMYPIVGTPAFAFSNPVFLDVDGNGYDNPPYAMEAMTLPPQAQMITSPRDVSGEEVFEELVHTHICRH